MGARQDDATLPGCQYLAEYGVHVGANGNTVGLGYKEGGLLAHEPPR